MIVVPGSHYDKIKRHFEKNQFSKNGTNNRINNLRKFVYVSIGMLEHCCCQFATPSQHEQRPTSFSVWRPA